MLVENTTGDPVLPENLPRIMPARRCARHSSRRTRPRVSRHRDAQDTSLWILPDELMLQIMRSLHVTDLLKLRSTHPYLRDLIDTHHSIWSTVDFSDTWPTQGNLRHFEKAANHGNIESLVKLGIAYLYNEGLPGDFEGKKITSNGEKAAAMFCEVEALTPHTTPFCWLFIRPPWAVTGACCKECVFNNMNVFASKKQDHSVQVCIAKTLQLLEDEKRIPEMVSFLEQAVARGSPVAAYLLWQHNYQNAILDRTSEIHSLRELRQVVSKQFLDAQLELCRHYCQGMFGGISRGQAVSFVREFIQASKPSHVEKIYTFQQLTHSMRYILMDWLVEVANMKDFTSLTLHVAIDVVDRYLKARGTTRAKLQLLGVAAMVLCSRFLGKDIITIREAAWLTDNTYKYEDVVRMMGEITATLKGKFRCMTSLDYAQLIGLVAGNDHATQYLAEYVCELGLLQSEMGEYPQAEVAASAVLLARLAQKKDHAWPAQMNDYTGYSMADLAPCASHMHHKCFVEQSMFDHRHVELQAVKMRYAEPERGSASTLPMLKKPDIVRVLGREKKPSISFDLSAPSDLVPNNHDLIMSPSRKTKKEVTKPCEMSLDREQAATPTLEKSFSENFTENGLNESTTSGYDGDKEDESYINGYDSDADLESLWCCDMRNAGDRAVYEADMESSIANDSGMSSLSIHGSAGEPESFSFLHTSRNEQAKVHASATSVLSSFCVNPSTTSQFISPPPGLLSTNTQFLTPSPVAASLSQLISSAPGAAVAKQFISPPPGFISNFEIKASPLAAPTSKDLPPAASLQSVSSIKSGQSGIFILGGDPSGLSNTPPGVRIYQDKGVSAGFDSTNVAPSRKCNGSAHRRARPTSATVPSSKSKTLPSRSHSTSAARSHTFEETLPRRDNRGPGSIDLPLGSQGLSLRDINVNGKGPSYPGKGKERRISQVKRKSSQALGNDNKKSQVPAKSAACIDLKFP